MERSKWVAATLAVVLSLVAGAALAGERPKAQPDAVAVVGGVSIGRGQLEDLAQTALAGLRSREYDIKRRVLDQEVERLLLEQEAAARKLRVEELLRAEVDAMLPEGPAPEESPEVRRQRLQQRRAEFVAELKARRGVRILLEPPRVAVDATGGPSKGPDNAPVTIVEFSDFQCPYCARVPATLKAIADRYGDSVRIVFRDYPLSFHKEAFKAAEAGACASDQGRFWEMHDKMFANQKSLQVAELKRYGAELGLDQAAFNGCLDSGRKAGEIQKSLEQGTRYGVNGTPSLFVNGRVVSGTPSVESFAQIVEEEIERVRAQTKPQAPTSKAAAQRSDHDTGGKR